MTTPYNAARRGPGCFGFILLMIVAGGAWWLIEEVTFHHPLQGALTIMGCIAFGVALRKWRHRRRRAENVEAAVRPSIAVSATATIAATPSKSTSHAAGHLQGLKDAKEAVGIAERLGAEAKLIFQVGSGAYAWYDGYAEGIHEVLPDAEVTQA
jgi:hypothetical protein